MAVPTGKHQLTGRYGGEKPLVDGQIRVKCGGNTIEKEFTRVVYVPTEMSVEVIYGILGIDCDNPRIPYEEIPSNVRLVEEGVRQMFDCQGRFLGSRCERR